LADPGKRVWPARAGASGQGPASPGTVTSTTDANGADRRIYAEAAAAATRAGLIT
jgi:hypothetical protein